MPSARISAPAKLNLFLHVTGRRADGYHLLESLVAFTEFGDALEIIAAENITLSCAGEFAVPAGEENLVLRAARLLKAHTGYASGAHITLHKHIPVGAGLGGGSADAAAALRGLQELWGVDADIKKLAEQLGSDVPVCIDSHPALMRGVGEQLERVALPEMPVLLVNPGVPLLTEDVFRRFSEKFDAPCTAADVFAHKHNALETAAISLLPVIGEIIPAIAATGGCRLARMSGSGATCFGLYETAAAAEAAAQKLRADHPGWWYRVTKLRNA